MTANVNVIVAAQNFDPQTITGGSGTNNKVTVADPNNVGVNVVDADFSKRCRPQWVSLKPIGSLSGPRLGLCRHHFTNALFSAISPAMRFTSASHHVKCCLLPVFYCAPHALEPFCHRDDCLGDAKVSLSWSGDSDGSSPRRPAKPISSRDIAST